MSSPIFSSFNGKQCTTFCLSQNETFCLKMIQFIDTNFLLLPFKAFKSIFLFGIKIDVIIVKLNILKGKLK